MQKKIFLHIIWIVLLASCQKTPDSQMLSISLNKVKATRCTVSIVPGDTKTTYAVGVMQEDDPQFGAADQEVIAYQIARMEDLFDIYCHEAQMDLDFADLFLYQGNQTLEMTYLTPGKRSEIVAFPIDAKTHKPASGLFRKAFETAQIDSVNLSFDVIVLGDRISIIPSDQQITYVYDYDRTEIIEEAFISPYIYMRETIELWEQYDFINSAVHKGKTKILLGKDSDLQTKDDYTLFLVGYDMLNHEINSEATIITFQY